MKILRLNERDAHKKTEQEQN